MRSRRSPTVASNAALVAVGTGSGTDQCSHDGSGLSSSWARSHTVTTRVGRRRSSTELLRMGIGEIETGTASGRHRAGMDPLGGMGAGAVGRLIGERRPQRRRQLGAGRVVGAHEQDRLGLDTPSRLASAPRASRCRWT